MEEEATTAMAAVTILTTLAPLVVPKVAPLFLPALLCVVTSQLPALAFVTLTAQRLATAVKTTLDIVEC